MFPCFLINYIFSNLGKGDLFGIDLQFEDPVASSSCSVKSLTYCELQCINLMGFISVLSLYPSVAEKIANAVQQELTFNLKDCEIDLEPENDFVSYMFLQASVMFN